MVKRIADEPDQRLVSLLTDMLEHAKAGRMKSFIGAGYMADGCRIAAWADTHDNVYEMLGSLAWLQHEYVHKHATALND